MIEMSDVRDRQANGRPTQMSTDQAGRPDRIEADIEQVREHLAETVDALHAKLDVKAHARAKAADVKDRATTDDGAPRPAVFVATVAVVALVVLVAWRRSR
jgi:MYXO-CTERM domain-containing protein